MVITSLLYGMFYVKLYYLMYFRVYIDKVLRPKNIEHYFHTKTNNIIKRLLYEKT